MTYIKSIQKKLMKIFEEFFKYLNDKFSFKTDLERVLENGFNIKYIKNPSEEVQLAAVEDYGGSIQFNNSRI